MKLLLTSGGIINQSMVKALRELLGKEFKKSKLVFIPTAANVEDGDKEWLIKDLVKCQELGFEEVDIIDIAALPSESWKPRLEKADVIVVGGGNTSYLMGQINKSGLAKTLPMLLKTRVYVGISAGSMVVAPNLREKQMQKLYEETIVDKTNKGLGFVDFLIVPHMNSPHFPRAAERIDEVAKELKDTTLYAIDDQTAVKIDNGKVVVVSEGKWKKFN